MWGLPGAAIAGGGERPDGIGTFFFLEDLFKDPSLLKLIGKYESTADNNLAHSSLGSTVC